MQSAKPNKTSSTTEIFKKTFASSLKNILDSLPNDVSDRCLSRLDEELIREESIFQKPSLPDEVIMAVKKYNTPAHQATLKRWISTPDFAIAIDSDGRNLAHHAAISGNLSLVKFLAGKGVDLETADITGNNVLLDVVSVTANSKQEISSLLQQKRLKIIKYLLDIKIPATSGEFFGIRKSAMCIAAAAGNLTIVEMLHDSGVSVNDVDLLTPLYYAQTSKNHALVTYLERHGAKLSIDSDNINDTSSVSRLRM